jgi:hypothetical protein
MKYGRILNNVIQEVFIEENGKTLENTFHPEVVSLFEPIEDSVGKNYSLIDGEWVAPPEIVHEEIPEEEPTT